MKQRITLYVDSDVWRAFRIRCLREKMSASAVVERWMNQLEEWPLDDDKTDTPPPRGARGETEETTMHNHNCHYVGPVAEGSPVCRSKATKAIMAVSDEQGKRLQAYSCDDHAEPTRAYFERIGHKQVTIEPIRS